MKKAFPVILLCLISLSFTGYAQGEEARPVIQTILPDGTAVVYDAWSDALKYANKQEQCTIRLLDNVNVGELSAIQYVHNRLVLDLNGFTLSAVGTDRYYRFLATRNEESSLTVTDGRILMISSVSPDLQAFYAPKGTVCLRNAQIDCFNHDGASASDRRTASAVSAGVNVAVEMEDVQVHTVAAGGAYCVQTGGGLTVRGGSIEAETTIGSTAYGIYIKAAASDTARCYAGSLDIAGTDIRVRSARDTGYGIVLGAAADSISGSAFAASAVIDGVTVSVSVHGKTAAALLVRGAEAVRDGVHYAAAAEVVVKGGTYEVEAEGNAYALNSSVSGLTRQTEDAYPVITLRDASFAAKAHSVARALALAARTDAERCSFTASADSINAHAAYLNNGTFRADSSQFDAQADERTLALWIINVRTQVRNSTVEAVARSSTAYGFFVTAQINDQGLVSQSSLLSEDNRVTATVQNGEHAYGFYLTGTRKTIGDRTYVSCAEAIIDGGSYLSAASDKSYCVFQTAAVTGSDSTAAARCRINGGEFQSVGYQADDSLVALVNTKALPGDLVIYGGFFSDNTNLHPYLAPGKYLVYTEQVDASLSPLPYMVIDGADERWGACRIGQTVFRTLEEALAYAGEQPQQTHTIVMQTDYTLPSGDYLIPGRTVLLVPANIDQNPGYGINGSVISERRIDTYPYLRLTLDEGVRLRCEGSIETGGRQSAVMSPRGSVCTTYGVLDIRRGAKVEIAPKGSLVSWGFVTGGGEIEVMDGGITYENFQIGDCKGGSIVAELYKKQEQIFPFNQYFIQNIETATTYHSGSRAVGRTCLSFSGGNILSFNIGLVGRSDDLFVFHPSDRSKVARSYDAETDRMTWSLYDASVGSIFMDFGEAQFHSADYVMPVPNNYTVVVAGDTVDISHKVFFAPDAQLRVLPSATLLIRPSAALYLYAAEDWRAYDSKLFSYSLYSPSWDSNPRIGAELSDARMYVGGRVVVQGCLHTTPHLATVYSDDGAQGVVAFEADALPSSVVYQLAGDAEYYEKKAVRTQPVSLTNADGSFVSTADSQSGTEWQYIEGRWQQLKTVIGQVENDSDTEKHSSTKCKKIIINGHLYIIHGENVFTPLGGQTTMPPLAF
ncbi:MAG: hypothetical protein K5660_06700 [Paludibacteraceae bacterium]|nr:hypothetical protein [Paludibacteraceae bacterium]